MKKQLDEKNARTLETIMSCLISAAYYASKLNGEAPGIESKAVRLLEEKVAETKDICNHILKKQCKDYLEKKSIELKKIQPQITIKGD